MHPELEGCSNDISTLANIPNCYQLTLNGTSMAKQLNIQEIRVLGKFSQICFHISPFFLFGSHILLHIFCQTCRRHSMNANQLLLFCDIKSLFSLSEFFFFCITSFCMQIQIHMALNLFAKYFIVLHLSENTKFRV